MNASCFTPIFIETTQLERQNFVDFDEVHFQVMFPLCLVITFVAAKRGLLPENVLHVIIHAGFILEPMPTFDALEKAILITSTSVTGFL